MRTVSLFSLFLLITVAASVSIAAQTASDASASNQPFQSAGTAAKRAYSDGKLELGAPFDVEMKATVGRDGKFEPSSITFTRSDGDAGMTKLVKNYLGALDQSGYLRHLADIGAVDVVIRARQDASLFNAALTTEMPNALRAMSVKTMATAMLAVARAQKERDAVSDADRRDLHLLNATTVNSSGASVIVALELPKATFREMVETELKK